jgi:murein DD-endopeptidase MepM/ murein hydrolase activator NlpD
MRELGLAWYTADQVWGPYTGHPYRCIDWNLESGGNTDLGQVIVAPFSGRVINAEWYRSARYGYWGYVVRILGVSEAGEILCWMGAHCDQVFVEVGQLVQSGEEIATIGTGGGSYSAHLHEQISIGTVPAPWSFPSGSDGFTWVSPPAFYKARGVDPALVDRCVRHDGK